MITYMTRSMEERDKIGNYRAIFGNAVGVVFGIHWAFRKVRRRS